MMANEDIFVSFPWGSKLVTVLGKFIPAKKGVSTADTGMMG